MEITLITEILGHDSQKKKYKFRTIKALSGEKSFELDHTSPYSPDLRNINFLK